MAESDTLRMAAEVVDRFSPNLRSLQQLLRGVHQEGLKQTKVQREGAEQLNRQLVNTGRSLRELVTPALASAGLATVGLSGAIASIGAAVGGFGKATYGLDLLSKQVGITTDTIKQLSLVAEGVQIPSERIEASVLGFAKIMEPLRRGMGDAAAFFIQQKQFGSEIGDFGDRLRKTTDNAEALRMVLVEMGKIPDPIQRGRFLEALQLPEELSRLYGTDIPAAMEKAKAALASVSKETGENAKQFEQSFLAMQTVLRKFRDEAAIELMPGFTEFVKEISGGLHELGRIITGLREGKPIFAPNFLKDLITPEPGTLLGPGPKAAPDSPEAFDAFNKKMEQRRSMRIPPAAFDSYQNEELKKQLKDGAKEGIIEGLREPMSYSPEGGAGGTTQVGGGRYRMALPSGASAIRAAFSPAASGGLDEAPAAARSAIRAAISPAVTGGPEGVSAPATARAALAAPAASSGLPGGPWGKVRNELTRIGPSSTSGATAPGVPGDILARAEGLLRGGGSSGELQAFMAREGYPRSGAWCGEFAASVVKSVGGTPPKGAAVASNWLNWGNHVDPADVQPGDVAARRRSRFGGMVQPGSIGGHVTFVHSYDPTTGELRTSGGNQGGINRSMRASEYEFRRGSLLQTAAKNAVTGGATKIEGGADLNINFSNLPPGTKTWMKARGVFDAVNVNRGKSMSRAAEE